MKQIFINLLAFGSLLSSVLVITSKNPVIAVIFLISLFINAAGYLILLGIGFIGISYIIIYIGAITVLFLFVIMLLNIKLSEIIETRTQYTKNLPLAFAIASLFIYEFFTIIPFSFNDISIISYVLNLISHINVFIINNGTTPVDNYNIVFNTINPTIPDITFAPFLQIQSIGHMLYTFGFSWLIITSVILLLSMVAPIFISKNNTNHNNNTNNNHNHNHNQNLNTNSSTARVNLPTEFAFNNHLINNNHNPSLLNNKLFPTHPSINKHFNTKQFHTSAIQYANQRINREFLNRLIDEMGSYAENINNLQLIKYNGNKNESNLETIKETLRYNIY